MLLTLIICTYKRPELLNTCVSCAISVLNKFDSELVIINDEKDTDIQVPAHPKIRVYNNPKQGLASARNLGAHHANGELLLFIDDDIEFSIENVSQLLSQYNQKPNACFNTNWKYSDEMMKTVRSTSFGRFLIHYGMINYKGWVPDINWQSSLFEVHKLAGFFMLIPKKHFTNIGGFNEQFVNQGTEDDEMCHRLFNNGIKMYVDPDNYVFHNELDRISLESRLARYYNGAINRRKAFELGHVSYEIKYSKLKSLALLVLLNFYKLIIRFSKLIPNSIKFDRVYFKLANVLIALAIYRGYTKK